MYIILLHNNTAYCGHPKLLSTCGDSVPKVVAYDGLPIEGSTIRFSCPPGLVLVGSDSAACTENGEWEPDPSGVMCRGKVFTCIIVYHDTMSGYCNNK